MDSFWQEPFTTAQSKSKAKAKLYTADPDLRENMSQGNCHLFYGRDHNNAAHWPKDKLEWLKTKGEKHPVSYHI